jgi:hypothetical protein
MKLEGSLRCSQEPSTGPYPEPDQSSPCHSILKLHGFSPQANYTDWAPAACRRS